jgi:hypothetical protein
MTTHVTREVRLPRLRVPATCIALAAAAALIAAAPAGATQRVASAPTCSAVSGAHWSIRGNGSGTTYKVVARGMSCSAASTWVQKLTRRTSPAMGGIFRGGPAGFTCRSLSVAASGDKLMYAGACVHTGGGTPFFGWAAKR